MLPGPELEHLSFTSASVEPLRDNPVATGRNGPTVHHHFFLLVVKAELETSSELTYHLAFKILLTSFDMKRVWFRMTDVMVDSCLQPKAEKGRVTKS